MPQASHGTSEGVGSFSLPEGLFWWAAKHHLHGRHCHTYISEIRSQKSTMLAICSETPAQLQSDKCVRVRVLWSLHYFEQSCYRRLFNIRDPLQRRRLNKDLFVVLSSLRTERNKLKGSDDSNWNNIGLASFNSDFSVICDFAGTHDFGWWFLADL